VELDGAATGEFVVAAGAATTVSVAVPEESKRFPRLLKVAITVSLPSGALDALQEAFPLASTLPEHRNTPFAMNVTSPPSGLGALGLGCETAAEYGLSGHDRR